MLPRNFNVLKFTSARFVGGDWQPVFSDEGALLGVSAQGTNCVLLCATDELDASGIVPEGHIVNISGNVLCAPVPQDDPDTDLIGIMFEERRQDK